MNDLNWLIARLTADQFVESLIAVFKTDSFVTDECLISLYVQSVVTVSICVRDGATRSGLVCTLSYVLERLKVEHDVDIFQSVRHARINRRQVVPSFVSLLSMPCSVFWRYCHTSVAQHSCFLSNWPVFYTLWVTMGCLVDFFFIITVKNISVLWVCLSYPSSACLSCPCSALYLLPSISNTVYLRLSVCVCQWSTWYSAMRTRFW